MNRERHRYWESYIHDLQGRMLLADWKIELKRGYGCNDERGLSEVDFAGPKCYAWITLGKDFEDFVRTEQRHAIVHELLHVHLQPLGGHLIAQLGSSEDEARERGRILRGHMSHEEYAVDDLARIIAPHMPLPPKVKP